MATIPEAFEIALRYHQSGQLRQAAEIYRRILAVDPRHVYALHLFGVAEHQQGRSAVAVDYIRNAIQLDASVADFHNNLGEAYRVLKKLSEAETCYRQALHLRPSFVEAFNNLGLVLTELGHVEEARACYERALHHRPEYAEAHNNLGILLKDSGRLDEAQWHYEQALRIKPHFAPAHNNLGIVYYEENKLDEAEACLDQTLKLNPALTDARQNLAIVRAGLGKMAEALVSFEETMALAPHDGLKIRFAFLLPVIPESLDDLERWRQRLRENADRLLQENLSVKDPVTSIGVPAFHLAYHGQDDRDLQARLAQVYAQATPSLNYVAPHCTHTRALRSEDSASRLNVGLVSRYFYNHPTGKFYAGVACNLSKELFRVVVFRFPGKEDAMARRIQESAARTVTLSPEIAVARRQIAEERPDVLFYTDIGMNPWTYFLAFARLAPVQCVGSGHPLTTGIPTVDYFLSDIDLEPEDGDRHYTEKLVRMRHFPFHFDAVPFSSQKRSRRDYGLEESAHLYVCAQTLFKIHPELDHFFGAILRADPEGRVLLFEGNHKHWTQLLAGRLRRAIPDVVDRVRFIPRQPPEDFLHVIGLADVVLDTIHFSGGTSTFEALTAGTPIVTLPGRFMRGRVTYACYRKMGVEDCVAADRDDYVKIAVRLGTDPAWRAEVRAKILAGLHVLYDNTEGVRELERFFIEAVNKKAGESGA